MFCERGHQGSGDRLDFLMGAHLFQEVAFGGVPVVLYFPSLQVNRS